MKTHVFVSRDDHALFVPWAKMALGIFWVAYLPENANRRLLNRLFQCLSFATVAFVFLAMMVAGLAGISAGRLIVGGLISIFGIYSIVASCLVVRWRRASVLEAARFLYPPGEDVTVNLLQQVLLGFVAIAAVIAFDIESGFAKTFGTIMLTNSVIAILVLVWRARNLQGQRDAT